MLIIKSLISQHCADCAPELDPGQQEELLKFLRSGRSEVKDTEYILQDIPDEELSHSYMEHATAIVGKGVAEFLTTLWEQQPLLLTGDSLTVMND